MIKTFNKYLIKRSLYFSFSILIIFGILDSIFTFISELEDISSEYNILDICKYVAYSMPHRLIDFIEGACLLGVMLSLGLSHQEGNLNVLRSAGEAPLKIVLISSIGAFLLTISLIIFDEISFRNIYLDAQANKNILSKNEKYNKENEIKWIKYRDSYLGFSEIINDKIYQAKLISIENKKVTYSIQSDTAEIIDGDIFFENDALFKNFENNIKRNQSESFEIPYQSKITFNNINNLGISEINIYRILFLNSDLEKDILFKAHLDKVFYKKTLLPISVLMLIICFGSLIFTSLRESTVGGRIIVAVVGAFIYKLFQDLTIGVFISYGMPTIIGVIIPIFILLIISIIAYKRI